MTEAFTRPLPRPGQFRSQPRENRWKRPAIAVLAALVGLAIILRVGVAVLQRPAAELRSAIEAQVESGRYPAELVHFYEMRDYAPLWLDTGAPAGFWRKPTLRPEARTVARLAAATGDRADAAVIARAGASRADLAKAELASSKALARYVRSLAPQGGEPFAFIDPALARPADAGDVLEQAAAAPSVSRYVAAVAEVNPVYRDLLAGLAAYHKAWSGLPQIQVPGGSELRLGDQGPRVRLLRQRLGLGAQADAFDAPLDQAVRRFQAAHGLAVSGVADTATLQALNAGAAHYEALIADNLRRARALPPVIGSRFLMVNVAARQVAIYQNGHPQSTMKVVVGSREEPTPVMIGLMRYVVLNPYWNIPVDIVRRTIAPRVLKEGARYLAGAHLEVLSDWTQTAERVDPRQVDWNAVANGWQELRVRQLPGGENMMGRMKFMLPNPLGIYLHDTPNKAAFHDPQRLLSAGCVRLESAQTLAAWLLGAPPPNPGSIGADEVADLQEPVPVYITYLTAAPAPGGVAFFPDVYGKDQPQPATAKAATSGDAAPAAANTGDAKPAAKAA